MRLPSSRRASAAATAAMLAFALCACRPKAPEAPPAPVPPEPEVSAPSSPSTPSAAALSPAQGAVAAPTASLHFDDSLLAELDARGVQRAFVTLHVGAGTFQPVRTDAVGAHVMHAEFVEVGADACAAIAGARARGARVIAVGTTVVRALESAADRDGIVQEGAGETRLMIVPGFEFKVVNRLITNFHLPRSTLLMLVSAFAGYETTRAAYQHAIAARYRFYSYGDACLLYPADGLNRCLSATG